MHKPYRKALSFLRAESGQDLAEYALLIGLIALVVLLSVTLLGQNMSGLFSQLASHVRAFW
jgi:Flp pilus assembly pilin Flp